MTSRACVGPALTWGVSQTPTLRIEVHNLPKVIPLRPDDSARLSLATPK